ncbi:MAG TPA: hypothetical protein VJ727_11375 [Rhodanobacteraceae bacterium]|nr:hypothetical protein [Rhodanobacteraceae bacterium]
MYKWLIWATLTIALSLTGAVCAEEAGATVKADNKAAFESVAAAVRQQLQPGGRWEYTSKLEKEQVNQRLDDMQALFEQFGTVNKMDQNTKARLFNDQEAVNEILTKRDDRHLVCESVEPIGTHIPQRVCRTYGDIRHEQDNARWELDVIENRNGGRASQCGGSSGVTC